MSRRLPARKRGHNNPTKLAELERLKQIRAGKSRIDQIDVEEQSLYDRVTEDEYQNLVEERRANQFVEDETGLYGYDDDGEEFIEQDTGKKGKKKGKKKKKTGPVAKSMDMHFFTRSVPKQTGRGAKRNKRKKVKKTNDDDAELENMLAQLGDDTADVGLDMFLPTSRRKKQKPKKAASNGGSRHRGLARNDMFDEDDVLFSNSSKRTKGRRTQADDLDSPSHSHGLSSVRKRLSPSLRAASPALTGTRKRKKGVRASDTKKHKQGAKRSLAVNDEDDLMEDVADVELDMVDDVMDDVASSETSKPANKLLPSAHQKHSESKPTSATSTPEKATDKAKNTATSSSKKKNGITPLPPSAEKKTFEKKGTDWFDVQQQNDLHGNTDMTTGTKPKTGNILRASSGQGRQLLDDAGKLRVFWMDAYEPPFVNSNHIQLFGKVMRPDKSVASVCITVKGIERNVFLLPRKFHVKDPYDAEHTTTDEPVEIMDVYKEFSELRHRFGIKKFMTKPVKRRYVFEKKSDDIPDEAEYLKVVYSAGSSKVPHDLKGRTFSHALGGSASALELFILKRKLMGPCWLTVDKAAVSPSSQSWCKYEFVVDSPKLIQVIPDTEAPEPPLISVTSMSLKMVLNPKTHSHEIVAASLLTNKSVSVEGSTRNPNAQLECITAVRPINKSFSPLVKEQMKRQQRMNVKMCGSERELLNFVLAKLHMLDPDVVVGHDLHGLPVEVLVHRASHHNLGVNWSKLGRLRQNRPPRTSSSGFSIVDQGVAAGRLLCDTKVTAKELLPAQKNYKLTRLAQQYLSVNRQEFDIEKIPTMLDDGKKLCMLLSHNENDAFLALSLMFKLEMIPLTKQLTSVCGNLWMRSLRSARAERVEFLLLHEFHKLKYIKPEKYTAKERREKKTAQQRKKQRKKGKGSSSASSSSSSSSSSAMDIDMDPSTMQVSGSGRQKKKPAYAGGLVLEPKRGFYDKFVLLLDFMSLYPSIIREYNICFSTVKHWGLKSQDTIPELPPAESEVGILPVVVRRLLARRQAVKKLMAAAKDPAQKAQLNIRQKAIKLVANSMYGCLGFSSARFYCKPLASLITSQGRDILQRTKELTENLGFNVIYGDTDSIMIYTGSESVSEVKKIGRTIQKEVNKQFQVLEIEIDGIFKTMLLLRKKKYAALMLVEKPDGTLGTKRELKGLDLVRRDWCELSKTVSRFILDQILKGGNRDDVVEAIHNRLRQLVQDVNDNKISMNDYIITKGLTKAPQEYPNPKAQPHVQVALQLCQKGKEVRVGDHIGYVICEGDKPMAERAYHPSTVMAADGALAIDKQWYLSTQILPPVMRLCEPIAETNPSMLASCLGLDGSKFAQLSKDNEEEEDADLGTFATMSLEDEEEKYKDCEPLKVTCGYCKVSFHFPGVFDFNNGGRSGLRCVSPGCKGILRTNDDLAYLMNTVQLAARVHINKFYEEWLRCNEPTCGLRTRQRPIRGSHCMAPGCKGSLESEYSDRDLYTQLMYYQNLFDVERARKLVACENKRRSHSAANEPPLESKLSPDHETAFKRILEESACLFIEENSYNYVGPSVFSHRH